ncbi:MAG: TonB-dependent receptor [Gemmatimonadota bacterium]
MIQLRQTFSRAAALATLSMAFAVGPLLAQATGTIAGQVTDGQSGRPLSEAQVSIPGTGIGTLSNSSGRYILLGVAPGTVTVRVELIGYGTVTQQVTVGSGQSVALDFQLGQTAIALDELVVTGVGQATERRALGTTVDVINAQAIEAAPVTNVQQLLQGRVAGATVSATSAQPGTGALINFRGVSSVFGAQTPVIYIDGVRVDNSQSTAAGTGGEQSSALADLMVSDIERVEVTKGGAASTLYGSDAATGVIQIFTKKGTPGAPRFTMKVEQGVDTPELKYMFDTGAIFPDEVAAGASPTLLKDNFFQNGHTQSYYLGVNGGSNDATYNVSGRIEQADGIQVKNNSVLYNLRGGVQATVSDKFRVEFSGSYTRSDYDRLFNGTAIADPLTTFEVGDALFFSGAASLDEALEIFLRPTITEEVNRFIFSAGGYYTLNDNISSRVTVGLDSRSNQQRIAEPIGFTPGEVTGELDRFDREFTSVSMDAAATFAYPLDGDITSSFTVGAQGFRDDVSTIFATGTTFALPGSNDFGNAADIIASEGNSELFTGGFYFDEQLSLYGKLYLGAGFRVDAGSSFGDQVAWETYPKGTISYVISEEDFFQDLASSLFSELKLRAAYGETGKFPPPFLADRSFTATPFRGESAPRFDNPGNADLRPEKTSTLEAGIDAALFNNRVGLSFTWYDAKTTDALFAVPEQPVTGLGTQTRNVGEITNTGIELTLDLTLLNTQSVAWSAGATYNQVDNRVTDMGSAAAFFVEAQKHVCGPPIDCDPNTPGLEELPVGAWFVTTPIDTNGDGLPDGSERQYTGGQPFPDKSGSFNTSLTLGGNLTLSALADWAAGFEVFDYGSVWATFNNIYRANLERCPAGKDPCDEGFPLRYNLAGVDQGEYSQSAARSAFVYDGDWFKLREIAARYALPESMASQLGASRATVYGSVRNVWIWSRNGLIDPELSGVNDNGLELGGESSITISAPRAFKFGVEVVF